MKSPSRVTGSALLSGKGRGCLLASFVVSSLCSLPFPHYPGHCLTEPAWPGPATQSPPSPPFFSSASDGRKGGFDA